LKSKAVIKKQFLSFNLKGGSFMYQKRFIKINCLITLFTFLVSIFSANFAFVNTASAQENILNKITDGIWKVKTIKGEFDAAGTGGYEKWADGKQRFVLRDSLGHLMSWGEAKIDKLTDGQLKVTVKDNDGTFEAVKVSAPALETVAAVKSAVMDSAPEAQAAVVKSAAAIETAPAVVKSAPAPEVNAQLQPAANASVETAPKVTIGQKLSALKTKITTPIENGGKGSAAWDKGYGFGKDTPSNIAGKVKGIFSKGDSSQSSVSAPAASSATPATAPVSASPAPAANAPAPAVNAQVQPAANAPAPAVNAQVQPAANAPAPVAVETAPKATIGQKLSVLKTKITTPIETGGKGSTAWDKGYSFGKDTPTNAVNKVKGIFSKNDSAAASAPSAPSSPAAASNTAAGPNAPAPSAAAPVAVSGSNAPAAAAPVTDAAPKATLGQKLSTLKTKVTTPIETGGKGSTAWEKGYSFGKDTPTNAVNKVKGLFTKNSSPSTAAAGSTTAASGPDAPAPSASAPAASAPASASTTASGPNAPAPAAGASTVSAPVTDAAPKATLGQKLSALKTKVTTPIETGGKGSEAWEKGYKFGKETPENAVGKIKGLFTKKSAAEPAVKEAAASEPTPSQKMADQKNAKVEFDEKTGQFQKAAVPAAPSKISTALSAGKDSLKASFSVKNLGISAGLTVGFKIFEQVKSGQKISIGKAVGHLATGEFAGSFVGSSLGSAAGTVVGSLLGSSIPVVGPILGALMPAVFGQVGGHLGASMGNDLASGQKPSFKKAIASIDKVAVLGQAVGSTIGAAIGSMLLPGFGSMIGGLAGSMIANIIINKVRNRAKSNYHISGVNAQGGQIIYSEQLAPPPAQPVLSNMGTNASGDGQAQNTYERMINAYKLYSQLLSEGKGETPECQQALSEYKQLYTNYAGSVQGQNIR
jgi:nucleoside 2-deoxyribosyltransferase